MLFRSELPVGGTAQSHLISPNKRRVVASPSAGSAIQLNLVGVAGEECLSIRGV